MYEECVLSCPGPGEDTLARQSLNIASLEREDWRWDREDIPSCAVVGYKTLPGWYEGCGAMLCGPPPRRDGQEERCSLSSSSLPSIVARGIPASITIVLPSPFSSPLSHQPQPEFEMFISVQCWTFGFLSMFRYLSRRNHENSRKNKQKKLVQLYRLCARSPSLLQILYRLEKLPVEDKCEIKAGADL